MKKRPLIFIAIVFILPVLAAKLTLVTGWYQGGKTNHGTLLTPSFNLGKDIRHWLLLYSPATSCEQVCRESLWQARQVHTLLAAEGDRVKRYMLGNELSATAGLNLPRLTIAADLRANFITDALYLVDPLGNVIMYYQFPADKTQALIVGKGLLSDLKRLLKVSKIG